MIKLAICEDIADDLKQIRTSCTKILKSMNVEMEIYEFEDGESLLTSPEEFDLLILDIDRNFHPRSPSVFPCSSSPTIQEAIACTAYRPIV